MERPQHVRSHQAGLPHALEPRRLTSLMAASRPSRDPETSAVLADPRTDRHEPLDGANYPRLAALEQKYDPTNFLRGSQNIL